VQVLDRVKSADRLPGVDEILLPGERGARTAASRSAAGVVPIEPNLLSNLRTMAEKAPPAATAPSGTSTSTTGTLHANGKHPINGAKSKATRRYGLATRLLHPAPGSVVDRYDASSPPLYQTATFGQPGATTMGDFDYTRSGNPTRTMFEEQWAAVEGAERAFAFTSGMAALAAAAKLVATGGHIVSGDDIYGGTSRLLAQVGTRRLSLWRSL